MNKEQRKDLDARSGERAEGYRKMFAETCESCEFAFQEDVWGRFKEGHVWCTQAEQWKKLDYKCIMYARDPYYR